jgi:hypothetical protein
VATVAVGNIEGTTDEVAAAIVVQRLRKGRGRATSDDLKEALEDLDFSSKHLGRAVRVIRDRYGDDALICVARGPFESPEYVLNPRKWGETRRWSEKMLKRALTESRHILHVMEWAASSGFATQQNLRNTKRYIKNVEEELESVLAALPDGSR